MADYNRIQNHKITKFTVLGGMVRKMVGEMLRLGFEGKGATKIKQVLTRVVSKFWAFCDNIIEYPKDMAAEFESELQDTGLGQEVTC